MRACWVLLAFGALAEMEVDFSQIVLDSKRIQFVTSGTCDSVDAFSRRLTVIFGQRIRKVII